MDDKYNFEGLFGMDRDCLQKLFFLVESLDVEKARAIYGMSQEHFNQTKHKRFSLCMMNVKSKKEFGCSAEVFVKFIKAGDCWNCRCYDRAGIIPPAVIPSSKKCNPYSIVFKAGSYDVFFFWDFEQPTPQGYNIVSDIPHVSLRIHHLNINTYKDTGFTLKKKIGEMVENHWGSKYEENDVFHVTRVELSAGGDSVNLKGEDYVFVEKPGDELDHIGNIREKISEKKGTVTVTPIYASRLQRLVTKCKKPVLKIDYHSDIGQGEAYIDLECPGWNWKLGVFCYSET